MEIHTIDFIKSSPDLESCPAARFPEYAFAGRSNVGKSSLLNLLINVKNLAKTSSTPGKTRLINHYLVNNSWYLVDLPGYGYARTGRKTRDTFYSTVTDYILHRESLSCLFILVDARHEPLKNDIDFIQWAGENAIPLAMIFTKSDKLSRDALTSNLTKYKKTLLEQWEELPPVFVTSSLNQSGHKEILSFIGKANKAFNK
jgi:GTP-binding protein